MKPGGEIKTSGAVTAPKPIEDTQGKGVLRDWEDPLDNSDSPPATEGKKVPLELKDPFDLRSDISLQRNAKQESTFERYLPLATMTTLAFGMGIAGLFFARDEEEQRNKLLELDGKGLPKWLRESNKDMEDSMQRSMTIYKVTSIFGFVMGAAGIGLGAYQFWQDHQKSVSVEADSKSVGVKYTKGF